VKAERWNEDCVCFCCAGWNEECSCGDECDLGGCEDCETEYCEN
jgi:hypothetical protein